MASHWWHRSVKTSSPVTDSFMWRGISDSLSWYFIWKSELTSKFTLASQRSFQWKTNKLILIFIAFQIMPLLTCYTFKNVTEWTWMLDCKYDSHSSYTKWAYRPKSYAYIYQYITYCNKYFTHYCQICARNKYVLKCHVYATCNN